MIGLQQAVMIESTQGVRSPHSSMSSPGASIPLRQ